MDFICKHICSWKIILIAKEMKERTLSTSIISSFLFEIKYLLLLLCTLSQFESFWRTSFREWTQQTFTVLFSNCGHTAQTWNVWKFQLLHLPPCWDSFHCSHHMRQQRENLPSCFWPALICVGLAASQALERALLLSWRGSPPTQIWTGSFLSQLFFLC